MRLSGHFDLTQGVGPVASSLPFFVLGYHGCDRAVFDPDFRESAQSLTVASNDLLLDVAEEALEHLEHSTSPSAGSPELMRLAQFAREQNERISETISALWMLVQKQLRPSFSAKLHILAPLMGIT